jgi:hypothetical protein
MILNPLPVQESSCIRMRELRSVLLAYIEWVELELYQLISLVEYSGSLISKLLTVNKASYGPYTAAQH